MNMHLVIIHSKTIYYTDLIDMLGCHYVMLIVMVVMNDCMLELQQRRKEETKTCDTVVILEKE